MTASAAELAGYLDWKLSQWERDHAEEWLRWCLVPFSPRPTAEELARDLLSDIEFRALNLGTFLRTDQGKLILDALEMVSPPFLLLDERLIAEALTRAAQLQSEGKVRAAKRVLGGGAVVVAFATFGRAAFVP